MFDIWIELGDVEDGCVTTYSNVAAPGVDLSIGASVTAGDHEGNTVQGVVVALLPLGDTLQVTLRLELETVTHRLEPPA